MTDRNSFVKEGGIKTFPPSQSENTPSPSLAMMKMIDRGFSPITPEKTMENVAARNIDGPSISQMKDMASIVR